MNFIEDINYSDAGASYVDPRLLLCKSKIAVVGMGVVGKAVASVIEERIGKSVLKLDERHGKKDYNAEIFFVCVPTPSKDGRTHDFALRDVLGKIPVGSLVVIRSTVDPDTAESLVNDFTEKEIWFMPEFLNEATAYYDAGHPDLVIIGADWSRVNGSGLAGAIVRIFAPSLSTSRIYFVGIREACWIKHVINAFMVVKNDFFNSVADKIFAEGIQIESVLSPVRKDPRIGEEHTRIVHKGGRGAGGKCLPKDFENFKRMMDEDFILQGVGDRNLRRLKESHKPIYGIQ